MPLLLIEPHDALIVRDGRAFDPTPGARASSLTFPMPSTLAGAVRTQLGTRADGSFDETQLQLLLDTEIRGPLLAEAGAAGAWQLMAHAPADALLLADRINDNLVLRKQLVPITQPAGLGVDPAFPTGDGGYALIGPRQHSPAKPLANAPRFWYWHQLEAWLMRNGAEQDDMWLKQPEAGQHAARPTLAALGHQGPESEQRTHVGIQPTTQTADEGMLFQTRGLEFRQQRSLPQAGGHLTERLRLGLVVAVEHPPQPLKSKVATLGGERRLAHWTLNPQQCALPTLSPNLVDKIVKARGDTHYCRIILLTPAYFAKGWRPTWLCEPQDAVTPALIGAAVGRTQVASGWDLKLREPKPSRRLAPAGSVFFLKLSGRPDAVRDWVTKRWLSCVSDDTQARSDGFGLAVVGAWSGALAEMKLEADYAKGA